MDVRDDDKGPPLLYDEFEQALEELENKKATGQMAYQQNC